MASLLRSRANRSRLSSQKKVGRERPTLARYMNSLWKKKRKTKYSDCVYDGAEKCIWLKCFIENVCVRIEIIPYSLSRKTVERESFLLLPPFYYLFYYFLPRSRFPLSLTLSVHFLGFLSGALDLPYLLIRFAISFNKTRSWLTTKLLYLHFVGISRTLVFEIVLSYV